MNVVMIGRNPEVATQPLFFGKKGQNLIYLSFYHQYTKKGIEPDLNRGLIHNINRKEQRVFGELNPSGKLGN